LLHKAEDRAAAFERMDAQRESFNERIREEDLPTPVEQTGTKGFLASIVHSSGTPEDADKSDFSSFASSFGLHRNHKIVLHLKQLVQDACKWWANTLLEEIQNETTTNHMQRMIRILKEICEDDNFPALKKAGSILSDKLADRVLIAANELKEQDEEARQRSTKPIPEMALKFADRIAEDLRLAAQLGASPKHPKFQQAKGIEVHFRLEVKNRHALKVLLGAKERQERDAKKAAEITAEGRLPDVGPATMAAEAIAADIERTVEQEGVMATHKDLKEAKAIAKALRDEDGQRKRMLAREKRLQEAQGSS
jgi:hypothetical protein